MISSYSVEGHVRQAWKTITSIDLRFRDVYEIATIKNAGKMDFPDKFNAAIQNKNIAPGETVHGWIAVDYGKTAVKDFRLRITDTSGAEHIVPLREGALPATGALPAQGALFGASADNVYVDLSEVPTVPYSEIFGKKPN